MSDGEEGIKDMMNDLYLLESEYQYRTNRARQSLKSIRYRKWQRRAKHDGSAAAGNEKNWIS